MNSAFKRKINGVQQLVILRNQVPVVSNAVTFAPLTSSVLSTFVSHKNRRQRDPGLLPPSRSLQQLLALVVVVFVRLPPRSDADA